MPPGWILWALGVFMGGSLPWVVPSRSWAAEPAVSREAKAKPAPAQSEPRAPSGRARRGSGKNIDSMLKNVQKGQPPAAPKHAEREPLPALSAADIAKAMAGVKTGASACSKRYGKTGVAELSLTVGENGKVVAVAIRGDLVHSPIAGCIEKAARAAKFPRNAGMKFDYSIAVR